MRAPPSQVVRRDSGDSTDPAKEPCFLLRPMHDALWATPWIGVEGDQFEDCFDGAFRPWCVVARRPAPLDDSDCCANVYATAYHVVIYAFTFFPLVFAWIVVTVVTLFTAPIIKPAYSGLSLLFNAAYGGCPGSSGGMMLRARQTQPTRRMTWTAWLRAPTNCQCRFIFVATPPA